MIAYKVVGKKKRDCSNWLMQTRNRKIDRRRIARKIIRYYPRYPKGKIVKAVPGSVGILCFVDTSAAEHFMEKYCLCDRAKIVPVRGVGSPNYNPSIFWWINTSIDRLHLDYSTRSKFDGEYSLGRNSVVAFEAVEVLE
jgi:hypothetical protein